MSWVMAKRRGKVIGLVRPTVSPETIRALDKLRGDPDLIGFAYVAMYRGYRYSADVVGEAKRVLTFTRGMLLLLDDRLRELLSKQDQDH